MINMMILLTYLLTCLLIQKGCSKQVLGSDALPDTTPKWFVSPPTIEAGIFCLLKKCLNNYNMEPLLSNKVTQISCFYTRGPVVQICTVNPLQKAHPVSLIHLFYLNMLVYHLGTPHIYYVMPQGFLKYNMCTFHRKAVKTLTFLPSIFM